MRCNPTGRAGSPAGESWGGPVDQRRFVRYTPLNRRQEVTRWAMRHRNAFREAS